MNQRFGRYELLGELARGGMGAVYRARDLELGREVAIKVITTPLDPQALGRFQLEGEAAARVRHPNVLQVHERGVHQGRPYLVMDLAAGSLRDRLRKGGALPGAEAARLLAPIADALGAVHAAQILHRDLKPENILLSAEGQPLLADFGIARAVDRETRYTQSGVLVGTPAYMAPEQASGEPLDARVDVYGLGAILYELVTGQAPFIGGTVVGILNRVLESPPLPPSEISPGLEPWVEAVCLRCLEKDPAERWADMAELAAALRGGEAALAPGRRSGLGVGLVLGVLGVLVLVGGGAALSWPETPAPSPLATLPPTPGTRVQVRVLGPSTREGLREVEVSLEPPPTRPQRVEVLREGSSEGYVEVGPQSPARWTLRCRKPGVTTWSFEFGPASVEVEAACPAHPAWYLELAKRPPLLKGVEPAKEPGDYRNQIDRSIMRWVPPGRALMKDPERTGSALVSDGFYLGKYEVSRDEYRRYLRWLGQPVTGSDREPLPIQVDFHGATRYARWAGGRLPTILEWNLAAFGPYGELRHYPWGEASPNPRDHDIETGRAGPSPVVRPRDVTPLGIHGMGGGLVEWVADLNPRLGVTDLEPDHSTPSLPVPKREDLARERGRVRETRGSSFRHDLLSAEARFHPGRAAFVVGPHAFVDQGFRLVRSPRRPEPRHLEWEVSFRTFANPGRFMRPDAGGPSPGGPSEFGPLVTRPLKGLKVLRHPWGHVRGVDAQRKLQDGFATFARSEVTLPAGRWVFSILEADDGVRLRVKAGDRVLASLDEWRHQVARHYELVVEVAGATPVVVEVEHCEILGGEELWVELSRE